ncbi:DNA-binding NarL/FixJ family response regulator [Pontibacter aydingkolensis]|uniref:DNA-binding response regulator n=1 Tax=Pontibacter aydingkolensis TaxID=1911536 RepID=A0ABS7CWC7_9BACT|nr:DNA-binding response regulator [Pontibacter aydingkolensis]MBW7468161.1 DNA-binding response regulator [Pontibacter aydingkolensis]
MQKNILIIEDERLVAEYISSILREAGYSGAAIADNRAGAVAFYTNNPVSLIISDLNLFGVYEGHLIVRELQKIKPAPVVYLTAYSEQQTLEDALSTEPIAYVLKPFTERQLLVAVKMALRQHAEACVNGSEQRPSDREMDIVRYLAEGYKSKEIAEKLFISENTVRTHRRNLLRKFDLRTSSELIAMAVKLKWIKS